MNYTETEIKLCRRLHELGVRPEIRMGDYAMHLEDPGEYAELVSDWKRAEEIEVIRDKTMLLFSWERAREWMRERRWRIMDACDKINGGLLLYMRTDDKASGISKEGQTDLEAILSAMVQVVEGEK